MRAALRRQLPDTGARPLDEAAAEQGLQAVGITQPRTMQQVGALFMDGGQSPRAERILDKAILDARDGGFSIRRLGESTQDFERDTHDRPRIRTPPGSTKGFAQP